MTITAYKNGSLMAHCGGYSATLETVADIRTPDPAGSHYPISHFRLIQTVERQIQSAGYEIQERAYALQDCKGIGGANFFGLLQLYAPGRDYALAIGIRNSHSMTFAASLALGSRIFVCDNLALSGEIKIGRKHTLNIERDLPNVVSIAIGRLAQEKVDQEQRYIAYQKTEISRSAYDHALIDLVRARAVSAQDIGKIVRQIEDPAHREHLGPDGIPTVWTVYNAITETIKGQSIFALPKRMTITHGRLDGLAGIVRTPTMKEALAVEGIVDADYVEAA